MSGEIGKQFQLETAIARLGVSGQKRGLPQPPTALRLVDGREVELPQIGRDWGKVTLAGAVRSRRSLREYSPQPLALQELGALLWATQGVERTWEGKEPVQKEGAEPRVHRVTFRTAPSAGARHALETLLVVRAVDGLASGVYQYLPIEHRLLAAETLSVSPSALAAACLGQTMVEAAAVTFVWVAVAERMTWRYGERGYRYLYLDAGHVCQNLYLACEAVGAGTCAIGAYDDDAVNELFRLPAGEQFVIYLASVGKKSVVA